MVLSKPAGLDGDELLNIQAQQVASNRLLWEIFMRLLVYKRPFKKVLLVNEIYNKHMLLYRRNSIRARIEQLIYVDRVLVKETKGGRTYVSLSDRGVKIATKAREINSIEIPAPKGF